MSEVKEPQADQTHLRIIDRDESALGLEVLDESDGRRLASVTSVSFEGKPEHSDALSRI